MNIGEFTSLSKEDQFKEAGRIAGVSPSVFDGLWATESGRGANMLSSAGAEGHFQLMPKTRKTLEGRFGTTIDPYNFSQSLYAAAEVMRENMGRFKNVPDALRAYNGGWDPAKWGNKETAAYAGKVLGTADANASTAEAVASGSIGRLAAGDLWDMEFKQVGPREKPSKPNKVADAAALLAANTSPLSGAANGVTIFGATAEATDAATMAATKLRDDTSFLDSARAAAFHEPINVVLRSMFRDPEPATPGFVVDNDMLKGYSLDEQKQLYSATSPAQYERIKFDIAYGKEQDEITFRNGTLFGIGASFLAEAPAAILTGGIASAGFRVAGLGAFKLAAEGRHAAAIASLAAEGIVGNVATEAAIQALGERNGVNGYAMAVAGGLLNPILGGRAVGRIAAQAEEVLHAQRMVAQAAALEQELMTKATSRLPEGATPEQVRAEMSRIETEELAQRSAAAKAPIEEGRKYNVGKTEDELAEEAGAVASPDMDSGNVPQQARWESPDFQEARVRRFATDPEWQVRVGGVLNNELDLPTIEALPAGVTYTKAAESAVTLKPVRALIDDISARYLGGDKVLVGTGVDAINPTANGLVMSAGKVHVIGLREGRFPNETLHTTMHELGHAVYHKWAPTAPPELMARIDGEWRSFVARMDVEPTKAWADRWAATSPKVGSQPNRSSYALSKDEFMAEQFVKHIQAQALAGNLGGKLSTSVIDQITKAVNAVIDYVRHLVQGGYIKPGKASDELFSSILEGGFAKKSAAEGALPDELKAPRIDELQFAQDAVPPALAKEVTDFLNDPVAIRNGLDRLPMGTPAERAEAQAILALYKKAEGKEYAVDPKRLSWLLAKVDSLNATSNMMLASKNPVVRMAAIDLLENGGGAGGRRSTASIAKHMNERAIVGNSIVDLENNFNLWFKEQTGGAGDVINEAFTSRKRGEFNRKIANEIEQRRRPTGERVDNGQAVRDAADSIEGAFERARLMQVETKTAGYRALPESSVGYMPHRMRSDVYRAMPESHKRALHGELTDQFITVSQFDPTFADQLASKYLDRVNARALGGFDAPMGLHQTGASEVIREALEDMQLTRPEIDALMRRHSAGAANHTKKRLDLDVNKTITADDGTTFTLLDVMDTNMLSLLRSQSQRVSGEVALARHGIYGKPGLAVMKRAMGYGGDGAKAVKKEIEAFDQVAAEFMGEPFGSVNKWVDRAVQFNSLSSLGGMGFNQLGEGINAAATLGVKNMLAQIPELGRIRSEVKVLAAGGKVNNGVLNSIETMAGSEFGVDAYKMVFPLDNPDLFMNAMGADTIHWFDKGLRSGLHLQSKLSLWRSIHSTQVRAVAEQIVLKTARAMRDGASDIDLSDMGISKEVVERLRKDMHNIVKWENGKVKEFDITKATDKEAAYELIQGIHRGSAQIIQGTFIGETGKYVHSSWLKAMTQFRTFSITAIDKQFNRQLANKGAIGMALTMMASIVATAPIQMARAYAASIGRADKDEYLAKRISPYELGKGSLNYIATGGLAGDFINAGEALAGGTGNGGRSGTTKGFFGNVVAPVTGKADKLWGALQDTSDGTSPMPFIKEMPFSRLPFLLPAINALTE
jgi:hypothetical protein